MDSVLSRSMSEVPFTLHIWPPKWGLQSLDPSCLAAVMYLQLTIPGKFKVTHCANPDESPNGQLPFLTHAHTAVTAFPSIVAFVASLAKSSGASGVIDMDGSLTTLQRAKKTALYAHVEGCMSDIVSHMFYGIDANFWGLTNPALASEMPFPRKYYVASRIREAYRPRLEAAGFWSLPDAEEEHMGIFGKDKKKKRSYKVTFERAFQREKVLGKAKTVLGVHASYLNGKRFYFGNRPTSLDVYTAAHILLLTDPPFPDAVLQVQLCETYPQLVEHARRIQEAVKQAPPCELFTPSQSLLSSLVRRSYSSSSPPTKEDPEDVQYRRRTWVFVFGLVALTAAFIVTNIVSLGYDESKSGDEGEVDSGEGEEELASNSGAFTDEEDN